MAHLQAALAPITAQLTRVETNVSYALNSCALSNDFGILPVPAAVPGPLPNYFPTTRGALLALTNAQLIFILGVYGVPPAGGKDANRNLLSRHLRIGHPPHYVV